MSSKRNIVFLLLLYFFGILPSYLHAVFSDEEIVRAFTVKNKTLPRKSGLDVTFSLYPSIPLYSSNPRLKWDHVIVGLDDLRTVGKEVNEEQNIAYRSWTLYINMPKEENDGVSHIGTISLREFFSREKEGRHISSSFLIINDFKILEHWEHQGIGRAVLSCFLETLEGLSSSQISHDIYGIMCNAYPGVYKMCLESGFNYFVNAQTSRIFDIEKQHDAHLLGRFQSEPSSSFAAVDVPRGCLIRREPGGRRLYTPYFFLADTQKSDALASPIAYTSVTHSVNVNYNPPLVPAPVSSSSFTIVRKQRREDNEYTCIFDKGGPIPDCGNPYQVCSTTLSASFLKRHKREHPSYQFPAEGEHVLVLGNYEIDTRMMLGRGDDGAVFLARHVPTGIYVAAKRREMESRKEKMHHEYRGLRSLGQLYNAWSKNINGTPLSQVYLILPFIDGKTVLTSCHPWIETTLKGDCIEFSDLGAGMRLLRSLVAQLNYVAERGAAHDPASNNIMVTHDHKNIVLIDFGYSGDLTESSSPFLAPFDPAEFNVSGYAYLAHCFLGTTSWKGQIYNGQVKKPSHIVEFLKTIPKQSRHFSLNAFNEAFHTLKAAVKD